MARREMQNSAYDASRRAFLRGRPDAREIRVRLPWIDSDRFVSDCTRCGECLSACPEKIIATSTGGFPSIDFSRGECTFCGACADTCPESLFDRDLETPWLLKAFISDKCLAKHRIMCRSCEDACPETAITFEPALRQPSIPAIDEHDCTGCGACVSICPESAITVR